MTAEELKAEMDEKITELCGMRDFIVPAKFKRILRAGKVLLDSKPEVVQEWAALVEE